MASTTGNDNVAAVGEDSESIETPPVATQAATTTASNTATETTAVTSKGSVESLHMSQFDNGMVLTAAVTVAVATEGKGCFVKYRGGSCYKFLCCDARCSEWCIRAKRPSLDVPFTITVVKNKHHKNCTSVPKINGKTLKYCPQIKVVLAANPKLTAKQMRTKLVDLCGIPIQSLPLSTQYRVMSEVKTGVKWVKKKKDVSKNETIRI